MSDQDYTRIHREDNSRFADQVQLPVQVDDQDVRVQAVHPGPSSRTFQEDLSAAYPGQSLDQVLRQQQYQQGSAARLGADGGVYAEQGAVGGRVPNSAQYDGEPPPAYSSPQASSGYGQIQPQAPPGYGQTPPQGATAYGPHTGSNTTVLGLFGDVPGYNEIGETENPVELPPCYDEAVRSQVVQTDATIDQMTAEQAVEIYTEYAAQNCCPASMKGKVVDIQTTYFMRYTLSTFTESRSVSLVVEPFAGGHVDGPNNGRPPCAWDIPVQPQKWFEGNSSASVQVPHSEIAKACSMCMRKGYIPCMMCSATGKLRCPRCALRVFGTYPLCFTCGGQGTVKCHCCTGGHMSCFQCKGKGHLKAYVRLTVNWFTYTNTAMETSSVADILKQAPGKKIFFEEQPKVYPVSHPSNRYLSQASQTLLCRHGNNAGEMIRRQQHSVYALPCTEVTCVEGQKVSKFFIYGLDNEVHVPESNDKNCCTIL